MRLTKSNAGIKYLVRRWTRRIDKNGVKKEIACEPQVVDSFRDVEKILDENFNSNINNFSNFHVARLFPRIDGEGNIEFVEEHNLNK